MNGRLQHRPVRRRGVRCTRWRFRRLVQGACDRLPPRFQKLLTNVVVTVEDEPSRQMGSEEAPLGFYEGTPLGQRGTGYTFALPDKITVYRLPLISTCHSQRELHHEVQLTVLHEIGHHFGMEDADLPF